jgi:hypothetical protein
MSKVRVENGIVSFKCPGCHLHHAVPVQDAPNAWAFNDDLDRPTLAPSILARGGCCYEPDLHTRELRGLKECDKGAPGEDGISLCHVCHSFVRDGRIEFLSDCTHALAGQTVDLPEMS